MAQKGFNKASGAGGVKILRGKLFWVKTKIYEYNQIKNINYSKLSLRKELIVLSFF
jgi:hypothetical protein